MSSSPKESLVPANNNNDASNILVDDNQQLTISSATATNVSDEKMDEIEEMIDKSMEQLLAEIENASPTVLTRRQQVNIYIVYFSVFLDNMGVSIVQPILPFYAETFEANSFQLGMLYSSYSLMATFATIFMAKMSDKFG